MLGLSDHLMLSRLQFAFTAMYHILWPVLTIGLSLYLVLMEALWLKTKEGIYYRQYRFWMKVFLLNLTMGVVTGIPMEFQFGTNWSSFSRAGGDIFGHLLGFEAAMAFMLEATFLGVMAFGWNRVPPGIHLFATSMVALGASLSAFWIMVANSWMQTPAGGLFKEGRFVLQNSFESIFNPDTLWAFSHMWLACLEITVFVLGGISAWYLVKGRHVDFFLRTFKIALAAALVVTPLQIWLGDGSGREVAETQPTKLAGIEAHWQTNRPGEGASWNIVAWPNEEKQANDWAIQIPYALSLITTRSFTGQVKGLREFPRDDQPPVALPFYAFRIMMAAGFGLFFLMLWTLWIWYRGRLNQENLSGQKKLLYAWMLALPLSYVAMEAGWITREVGRQPWIIYGVLRTRDAATSLPAEAVASSSLVFVAVYLLLFAVFLLFLRRILLKGPELGDPERKAGGS
jgi:cytochrome bd ubiquinol oxidase subunit I